MGRPLILAGVGFALLACGLTKIRPSLMKPRLQYTGFSFARPPSESWYIWKMESQLQQVIVRHVDLPGEYHDAFVAFRLYGINSKLGQGELADYVKREDLRAKTVIEFRSYTLEPIALQNQECVSVKVDADVTSQVTDAPLRTLQHTITCIHPAFPNALVEAMFSERGPPDAVGRDPVLEREGEEMLRGFEIDVAEATPAK